jgi:hypothetical protein
MKSIAIIALPLAVVQHLSGMAIIHGNTQFRIIITYSTQLLSNTYLKVGYFCA